MSHAAFNDEDISLLPSLDNHPERKSLWIINASKIDAESFCQLRMIVVAHPDSKIDAEMEPQS